MSHPQPRRTEPADGARSSLGRATWGAIVIGSALRVAGALGHPVEQDEIYTVMESQDLFLTTLQPGIQARPLYYLIQHALFELTPAQEPYTRFLPVLFGILGLWLVAVLARRAGGRNGAFVTAVVAALSPWHINASETARYYSLVFVLLVLAALWIDRAVGRDTVRDWGLAASPVVVGTFVHPSFLFGAAGLSAVALLLRTGAGVRLVWPSRSSLVGFALPVGLTVAGFYGLVVLQAPGGAGNMGPRSTEANSRLLLAIVEWTHPVLLVAAALGFGLALLAAFRLAADGAPSRTSESPDAEVTLPLGALALAAGALSTVALTVAAARFTAVYTDYAVGVLPAAFLGSGVLASRILSGGRLPSLAFGALLAAGLAPSTVSHVIDGTRFDYRPALAFARRQDAAAPVLAWPVAVARHYAPDLDVRALDRGIDALDADLARSGRLWAILSVKRHGHTLDNPALDSWVERACRPAATFERPRFDYRQYRVVLVSCDLTRAAR
jgi:hypothetical protein